MGRARFTDKLIKLKKDQILIGILAGVLLLVIALPQGGGSDGSAKTQTVSTEAAERIPADPAAKLERKLQAILQQVSGVGRVQVMLTLRSTGRKVVEKDASQSEESSAGTDGEDREMSRREENTVYQRNGQGEEAPFVVEETVPEIAGVLVAAQGGDSPAVAQQIVDAAMVLFGVEAHKIKVMKLN